MASSAIFLTIIFSAIFSSTNGFKIESLESAKATSSLSIPSLVLTSEVAPQPVADYRNQPIVGYPKVPPPNAQEAGGREDDLLPPFEDAHSEYNRPRSQFFRRSVEDVKVDPKTGYPLVAETSWKYAGGNEENLELPLEDSVKASEEQTAVDPKTGYPLFAQPNWKDAGGDEEIISLPFEDTEENFGQRTEGVDPKTGYPLEANPSWKDAGGNEEILEPPLEDLIEKSDKVGVDPKTGYPLVAQESWKDAGGNEEILELPLEEPDKEAIDPKTGYPLVAQPSWKDAGGDGDILKPPLEDPNENSNAEVVDPKTGYPLTAQPSWKEAGGNGDILQLPFEDAEEFSKVLVDSKTDHSLTVQPRQKHAGDSEDISQLPQQSSDKMSIQETVDPKTGYSLIARPEWKDAGGDDDILKLPFEHPNYDSPNQGESRSGEDYDVFEIFKLMELQPPPLEKNFPTVFSNSFSTPSPFERKRDILHIPSTNQNQKRNSFASPTSYDGARPIESSYAFTGPENVIVTVTRFLSTDKQEKQNYQPNSQRRSFL